MKKEVGFTLIELMIVVVVVAILMTIALPAYQNYVRKAKRSDAMDALMTIQQLEERHRANNSSYTTDVTGTATGLGFTSVSLEGYYDLGVTSATSTGYRAAASARSGTSQVNDSGCTTMVITVNALNPRGSKTPADCW